MTVKLQMTSSIRFRQLATFIVAFLVAFLGSSALRFGLSERTVQGIAGAEAAAGTTSRPVSAADAKRSEVLVKKGVEMRLVGKDLQAVPVFREAHELDPNGRTAGQLGLCLQAVGRWADAERHLSESLENRENPWVEKNRMVLHDALETVKSHVARVEVSGQPEGASISVNGVVYGELPLAEAIAVNEGVADILASKEGFAPLVRSFTLKGGQYQRVGVDLQPLVDLSTNATAASVQKAETSTGLQATAAPQVKTGSVFASPWLWAGVGAVVVGGVVAGLLLSGGTESAPPIHGGKDFPGSM